ncbi:DNA annealing helicase and endonuclease ZRANB3 isoform X2 [Salvia splendens]|uniref:DNA annealing helicase and endonuclease ZRANB3 isoform X2 n=1 Tax=Salvia splendens TaxID=180675 RepID=UPI001C275748|nr:DNA annealing helicase and endonuclease ZRANB3 isoform X2 [Salvia splendens]
MENREENQVTEEQRRRAEANRAAALAKRKAILSLAEQPSHGWDLSKCRKLSPETSIHVAKPPLASKSIAPPEILHVRVEICAPDSFSVSPVAVEGLAFPGEDAAFEKLADFLSNVTLSHYTQNTGGGRGCVYRLYDYHSVLKSLKSRKDIVCEEIPWCTFNVVEKFSHSFISGRWTPCRPEHFPDEKVDELISELPKAFLKALLPFQVDGVRFGLRRGGRCLIADEMGLGKTLQAIAIAACFRKEGSILVVCPAILRYSWAEELERWFPFCLPSDIHLVFRGPDNPARLTKLPRIVVISYTMLRRLRSSMLEQDWVTLIVDESHHLHCSKQSSEKDELQVVLDVATKVKHLILLSGTPSLSRPFDIFHQINMLWPGLLGKGKYDFAKTYCSLKKIQGRQGIVFKIRRLKEHVLLQLPPKRRQIIKLVLSKSDINSAMVALGLEDVDTTAESDAENAPIPISDDDPDCDMKKKLSKKLSALGLAKLPGFFEWLSFHPIMLEKDGEEIRQESSSSHKMIIFAYHHKVLDYVQAFLCEKAMQFVRIDCTVTGVDRQAAIQSFQSSKEVKIALIGIRAGSTGLNLTSADTVVFVELPTNPADIQQAEDRAHRHGQKRVVNVYIFCAKDTSDELQWQQLNRSLLRVSSTVNGKRHAIREIEVEGVSSLESTRSTTENIKQSIVFQNACVEHEPDLPKASSDMHVELDNSCVELHESEIALNGDGRVNEVEYGVKADIQRSSLRFEVSQHTGRIHLYSCTSETQCRPSPLFKSFRQEEVECHSLADENEKPSGESVDDNSIYMEALMSFINEWKELRPIERRRLINKPLQLPLSCELCYLNESLNHETGGLLRGGSSRRKTPLDEIGNSLPSNAAWRNVSLCSGQGQKTKTYTQAWSDLDEPLCKLCQNPCMGNDAKLPQFFEDLFCGLGCFEEYRSRTSNRFLRQGLFQIEHGICTNCHIDCHRLVKHLRVLSVEKREAYIKNVAPNIASHKKMLAKLVQDPSEGNAWHADHIIPVYKGGGECKLENLRTLCIACHADVTSAQCAERRIARKKAKKQLKVTMSDLINSEKRTDILKKCEQSRSDTVDDDLLIHIPGSAYSGPNINGPNEQNQQPEVVGQSSTEHILPGSGDGRRVVHCKKS